MTFKKIVSIFNSDYSADEGSENYHSSSTLGGHGPECLPLLFDDPEVMEWMPMNRKLLAKSPGSEEESDIDSIKAPWFVTDPKDVLIYREPVFFREKELETADDIVTFKYYEQQGIIDVLELYLTHQEIKDLFLTYDDTKVANHLYNLTERDYKNLVGKFFKVLVSMLGVYLGWKFDKSARVLAHKATREQFLLHNPPDPESLKPGMGYIGTGINKAIIYGSIECLNILLEKAKSTDLMDKKRAPYLTEVLAQENLDDETKLIMLKRLLRKNPEQITLPSQSLLLLERGSCHDLARFYLRRARNRAKANPENDQYRTDLVFYKKVVKLFDKTKELLVKQASIRTKSRQRQKIEAARQGHHFQGGMSDPSQSTLETLGYLPDMGVQDPLKQKLPAHKRLAPLKIDEIDEELSEES